MSFHPRHNVRRKHIGEVQKLMVHRPIFAKKLLGFDKTLGFLQSEGTHHQGL